MRYTSPMNAQAPVAPAPKPLVKPPHELVCSSAHLLKRLGLELKEVYTQAFEEAGAAPYYYSVLAVLEESPRETQSTIADSLGYDRSWLVGVLDELEEKGLIERKRDPADRRRHVVTLLPAGKRKLAELRKVTKAVDDEFLAPLSAKQRESLHDMLLVLVAHHDPRYRNGNKK
jgi:MarR family transcriptional regulator, lower aerobic nicotinate degradation pathway regulator